ncbi:hypothetical protein LW566_24090, partial [Pseudomonas juntendi]|uniref:hypothetical protein n=1 Tax=Pseudomonas juntendi TaxID=2666183 RepID=UPI0020949436
MVYRGLCYADEYLCVAYANEYPCGVNAHTFAALEILSAGFDSAKTPAAIATHSHLFALTASHFLSDATKSNQKTLRSRHPAPALR